MNLQKALGTKQIMLKQELMATEQLKNETRAWLVTDLQINKINGYSRHNSKDDEVLGSF